MINPIVKTIELPDGRTITLETGKLANLLGQIDNVIAQENSSESNEEIEFTPVMLTEMAGELRQALEQVPEPSTKEEKTALKKKRKQLKELEEHRDKLQEYDNRLDTLQDRNSYSKTDNDATFMRMKEDAMRNGQTKPGYNLQIGTGNQFITDFALFPNPTDTLTLIPFLQSFSSRYDRLAHTVVADSGYGSEENYRFMSENGMEAYVKYNYFHMEQRPRFKPDPFKAENFYYNEEQDFCICPMGQKMQRIGTRHVKTASGSETMTIPKEFIGAVIGPGGKIIQGMQEETGATITIEEVDNIGRIEIAGTNKKSIDDAMRIIKGIVAVPEVGEVYKGKVRSIMPYGAFVEFLPGKDGLLHISEIDWKRLETVEEAGIKEGDEIDVKLLDIDPKTGKFKLSRKVLLPRPERQERPEKK